MFKWLENMMTPLKTEDVVIKMHINVQELNCLQNTSFSNFKLVKICNGWNQNPGCISLGK